MAAAHTNPILRIKLVKSAKTAEERVPGDVEKVNNYLCKLFEEADLNLEAEATEEARKRNRKRVMELCKKMEATEEARERNMKRVMECFEKMEKKLKDQQMSKLKQLNMAAAPTNPTLRIAKTAEERVPNDPGDVEKVNNYLCKLFEEADLNLETEATVEVRARNRKRVMELCKKMEAAEEARERNRKRVMELNRKRIMELFQKIEATEEARVRNWKLVMELFKKIEATAEARERNRKIYKKIEAKEERNRKWVMEDIEKFYELTPTNPTLRIAKTAEERVPNDPGDVEKVNNYLCKLFGEADLNLETEATVEARQETGNGLWNFVRKWKLRRKETGKGYGGYRKIL
ncbi:hypothetical protein JTE90_010422 [Oedothorax gibbosus]|uniref:Uncharacterized protein n=1 Tax=Oedothorax gibbosus TaxID=931172 RepID=A0AAV6VZL4_9ARAC|nr:hypothetical protein JTE90_010422 [Oedothorax gibbosus]